LQAWFSAGVGVTTGPTGAVSQWADQSGAGHHATQTEPGAQPTLQSKGIKGLPAVLFDGTDDGLTVPVDINPAVAGNVTIYAVFASETDLQSPNRKLYSHDDSGYDRTAGLDARSTMNYSVFTGNGSSDYFQLTIGTVYQTTDIWTPTKFTGRVNGKDTVSIDVANASGLTTLGLGRNPSYSEFWQGPIAEFIVYVGDQSAADRAAVENYLAKKYSL
jgi:hypothetical protein